MQYIEKEYYMNAAFVDIQFLFYKLQIIPSAFSKLQKNSMMGYFPSFQAGK